jgi:hypothetical protein
MRPSRIAAFFFLSVAPLVALAPLSASARTLDYPDGVNVMASYFGRDRGNLPIGWDLMRRFPNIGTVRIEIEPDEGVALSTMQAWIRGASASGCRVIVTHHCYKDNGSDDPEAVQKAARWWRENYAELAKAGPFAINLINEWGSHDLTAEAFAAAYNRALPVIREFYDGPVIVDIPGWAQETVTAAKASPLIKDDNIVFSIHIYSSNYVVNGPHHWMQPQDLVEFAKVGRPVMIGEFGGMREGGADWRALVAQAKALGWTVLAWAWNGDGEGMNMVWPQWGDNPAPEAYWPSPYFGDVYAFLGESVRPQLSLSVGGSGITLGSEASLFTYAVHSTGGWSVSTEPGADWIEWMNPSQGWGDSQVTFSVSENPSKEGRSAVVTIRCAGIVRKFTIHQNGAEAK